MFYDIELIKMDRIALYMKWNITIQDNSWMIMYEQIWLADSRNSK